MKQIITIFAVLVLVVCIIGLVKDNKKQIPPVVTTPTQQETKLCYYRSEKTASGFYDRAWIRINLDKGDVSGEFRNLPAEKDSKVGTFTGSLEWNDADPPEFSTANVIWNSMAEGMQAKEELSIRFNGQGARPAFGEMVQGANGVYVYKDKANVVYQAPIPPIDCAQLDEITAVESYVRSTDLQALTKDSPVLGGKLFVSGVVVDPGTHTATISYEDGHVAGKGTLTYTFANGKVTVTSFVKAK